MTERPEGGVTVVVIDKGRMVRADYWGGPYVDLTFGMASKYQPTEVINVWDSEAGKSTIGETAADVKAEVKAWIEDNDTEWPEWYAGYLENARY